MYNIWLVVEFFHSDLSAALLSIVLSVELLGVGVLEERGAVVAARGRGGRQKAAAQDAAHETTRQVLLLAKLQDMLSYEEVNHN